MEPFVLNLEAVHKAAAAATASAPWQPMQPPPTTCASYTTTKRPPDVPRESAGRPLPTIATCPPLMEAEQQLIALGSELTPLRTPDEALTFLRAMGRFPPGTPARAEQIVRECRHPLLLDASHVGGGEVTFKVAYLTTDYDPTLIYGVKTTIETLTNTRLSCIHTSYPKCSHLVWRQSIALCL
jgi:hypothetical protein